MRRFLIPVLAGLFVSLFAQGATVSLRVQNASGSPMPCNASILSSDFNQEITIVNGVPEAPAALTLAWNTPGDPSSGSTWYLSAEPIAGYEFVEWKVLKGPVAYVEFGEGAGAVESLTWPDPVVTATIYEDTCRLVAVFRLPKKELTVSHDGNASAVSPTVGTHLYDSGTVVTLNASPVAGYQFLRWEDPLVTGTPHPDVDINTAYTPPRYSIVMDGDFAVRAVFGKILTVRADDPGGPSTLSTYTQYAEGAMPTISVPNSIILLTAFDRYRCYGWAEGTHPIPVTGFGTFYPFISGITNSCSLKWKWLREYAAQVSAGGSGFGSISGVADGNWYTNGTVLSLNASPGVSSLFSSWTLSGATLLSGTLSSPLITIRIDGVSRIEAIFDYIYEPWAFMQWKQRMGLGSGTIAGVSGQSDDPDGDGLSNWQEFHLVYTNATIHLESNPLNADTDGDGMIDGWEASMFHRESNDDPRIIQASLDGGTYSARARYGRNGNADGDFLWSTSTGWETTLPLYNWLEYVGPDGEPPFVITNFPSQTLGLPAGRTVYQASTNLLDSVPRDSSHPLNTDSDLDVFDDGYEYSWDRWQQANNAALMTVQAALWPGITEDVQTMIGAWAFDNRPFNPAVPNGDVYVDPNAWQSDGETVYTNSANMDLDYWFNQAFGVIDTSRPLSDLDEYLAFALTSSTNSFGGVPVAYPVVRPRPGGTTTRWCTNPFVWDTDGDGLPDGWELTFGFDPWTGRSINAGTPANLTDATFNPDLDGFAFDAPLRHHAVYNLHDFNPNTGYRHLDDPPFRDNTAEYDNYQELLGITIDNMNDVGTLTLLNQASWLSTHPRNAPIGAGFTTGGVDSDGDGMYDGWEAYVDLNPLDATDAPFDQPYDADGLTNFEEFDSAATSPGMTNAAYRVAGWYNKRLPTDPWDLDTDLDQMTDGTERDQFNDDGPQEANGGLCPTTVDSDGDFLPDSWETYYGMTRWTADTNAIPTSVNGTISDAFDDPDGDTILNYQEYMTGTMYHWQFQHVTQDGYWRVAFEPSVKPMGLYQYDPYDFLDPAVFGRQPYEWDENYLAIDSPPAARPVPFTYLGGCNYGYFIVTPQFSTADPGMRDSDMDMMDDHYEIYHGLNPVYGFNDLVRRKYALGGTVDAILPIDNTLDEYDSPFVPQPPDLRRYPWMAGDPLQDPDQDQILSIDEGLLIDGPVPPATHTDPSPLWMTDLSSPQSWVNQFYWLGNTMGQYPAYWFWDSGTLLAAMNIPPPSYMFSFEMNDGFDTDNDGIADRAELVHNSSISVGVTDPLDSMSPPRRRALYVDGSEFSAARTATGYAHGMDDLRRFTVEVWVRPSNPQRGVPQTIVERTGLVPQGNHELPAGALLANFKLGIDPDGLPFAAYNGNAMPYLFTEAKAPAVFRLRTDEWFHLAATFDGPGDLGSTQIDGMWVGMLKLYVNGRLAAAVPSSEIPVNGVIGGIGLDPNNTNLVLQTGTIVSMSVNVGASDYNSGALIHGDEIRVGPAIGLQPGLPPPVFYDHFQGHIDEIRIWNRGRTETEINRRMRYRFTREEVTRLSEGDDDGDDDANPDDDDNQEVLRYFYTFDDLPDPSTLSAPVGFSSVNGRPLGYFSSLWWGSSSLRSDWYDDYRWIPWIENLVAHRPLTLPLDATYPAVEMTTNGTPRRLYHNTSNPYTLWYRTGTRMEVEDHPFLGNDTEAEWAAEGLWGELPIYPDLLPCGSARTDESVPLWDNGTPGSSDYDTDGDRMADWWEITHGLDYLDPNGENGEFGDLDRDGLNNFYEYLVGGNPRVAYSLDPAGLITDDLWDSDGDGLANGEEQLRDCNPILPDSDDDSFTDGWEVRYGSDPNDPLSPEKPRALALDGQATSFVLAPDTPRLELTNAFDISAWVYPTAAPAPGALAEIVAREIQVGSGNYNYRLSMDDQRRMVASFSSVDRTELVTLTAPDFRAVPLNAWTHVGMTFNDDEGHLTLLLDGLPVAMLETVRSPAMAGDELTETRVGRGFTGFLDDVVLTCGTNNVLSYLFDDDTSDSGTPLRGAFGTVPGVWYLGNPFPGTWANGIWEIGQVEDFAGVLMAVATNWQGRLRDAGSLVGGATFVALIEEEGELLPDDWVDTDGDGLPDEWEVLHGLNPLVADTDGDGIRDGDEDTDFDGLNNLHEYLADTDPNDPQTVNGTFDGDGDADGDGLSNLDEQNLGSDPGLADTDDDGISDLVEVSADADGYTLPNASLSPARAGALRITAAGQYASLPLKPRFRLEESWTIEAWVNIASTFSGTGTVIKRGSGNVVNYELGFAANRPFVRLASVYGASISDRIVLADDALNLRNHWYHLAGVYDFAAGELRLYVDGVPVKWSHVGAEPGAFSASGLLPLRVGEGFRGMIDEVRIWAEAREVAAISDEAYRTFEHASAGPLCELRFDDFGTTAEDFARPRADWTRNWSSAATLTGAATLVAASDSPVSATAFVDEDADELPDFWELALFGNIFGGTGQGDPDGDGLNNLYEYLSRLHPLWASTWDDSTWDGNRDLDGDGLLNILEQGYSTMPNMSDTDDDGFTDYQEIYGTTVGNGPLGLSNPLRSLDPLVPKGLQLDGTGRMVVPAQGRHSLTEWTLAAWVRPTSANNGGIVIARTFSDGAVNYELGVEQDGAVLRPYTRYTSSANGILKEHKTALSTAPGTVLTDGVANQHLLVERDVWTHLAAVYSITNHTLTLFVNGESVALRTDAIELPDTGSGAALPLAGELTVGGGMLNTAGTAVTGGFEGAIDDVRIAALVSSVNDIRQMMGAQLVVDPATVVTNTSMIAASALPAPKAGEFLVGLKPGVSADATVASLQAMNIQVVRRFNIVSAVHVRVADGTDAEAVRAQMAQNPNVAYVEPNYSRTLDQTMPNDPSFGELWGLHNTGQSGGTEDADIDAPEAWDVSTGKSQVLVAVIDTGIDYNHPDLAANMWVNPGEVPGNGLDDDGNGYVDDVYGYDFANGDSDPMDVYGHGTHCSGTIGAVGNNATAVAGVNWSVRLMALKIFDDFGGGATDAGIVAAIEYAVRMGARVSNNSYGGGGNSQTLYDAIARARDADHLFVASAGNNGSDNDAVPHYPSSYDLDNIIAVAASDRNDTLAYFSNYGAESVDLAAPGVAILSTVPGGGTAVYDGTSMAGPHVAGAAALILSVDGNLSYTALRSALLGNVDALDVLNGRCLTGGRLNVGNILPKMGGGTQLAVRSLAAWYRFDDGGTTVEDFTLTTNWRRDWRYAGRLQYTASMAAAAAFLPFGDTDDDGLPDWWEELVGLDARDATGDNGADVDPDGDGLVNFSEYLASLAHFARGERGLNPFLADSDNDGLTDAQEDSDLDGIANIHEQNIYATDPGDADTDDDGSADGAELTAKTLPTDSSIPYVARALTFTGGSAAANVVTVPDKVDSVYTSRHSAEEWTVEAWVNRGAMANGTYPVISRRTVASNRRNYEIGLINGVPYVAFDGSENGAEVACQYSSAIPVNTWTHLAARFRLGGTFDQNQLSLFVDGVLVSSVRTGWRSATGPGDLHFGSAGLIGQLLNVRVWSIPQSDEQIAGIMNNELLGGDVGDMSGYLSLTGAGHLKETATTTKAGGEFIDVLRQNWTLECWVRTTATGGRLIQRRNQSMRTDQDFNYYLGITPTGTLEGRFAMDYTYMVVVPGDPPVIALVYERDYDLNTIMGEIPINDDQWHHVAYVRSDSGCALYVDGLLDVSQDRTVYPPGIPVDSYWIPPAVYAAPGPCIFGEDLAGSMDEIRIWNRTLPTTELRAMSAVNLAGDERGLISYFNFDFQLGETADERAYARDPESEYGIYIPDATRLAGTSDGPPIIYDPLRAVQGIALSGMFLCNDGGTYVEDRVWRIGLNPFDNEKYAGRMGATATWATQVPVLWYNGQDSDGDGLPDAWERDNGLDPFNVDSDGNGVGDFFDDMDHDGLSNGGEWRAGTDPWKPDSDNDGINDYEDTSAGSARMNGVRFSDNDYVEDYWEDGFVQTYASPDRYDEHYDLDGDGWNNWSERRFSPATRPDMTHSQANTNSVIQIEYPTPNLTVTLDYLGSRDLRVASPTLVVHAYTDANMNGMPDAVYRVPLTIPDIWPLTITLTPADLQIGHLRQGLNWFYAFVDLDGSQRTIIDGSVTWLTWTAGEPAAVADGQIPGIDIGWDRNEVRFLLTDEARSCARFSWAGFITDNQPHTISIYHAVANTLVFTRSFTAPRTWLHEGDIVAGKTQEFGLGWGVASGTAAYRWTLDGINRGYVTNLYAASTPVAITDPRLDDIVQESRPEFSWRMSPEAAEFEIEIRKGSAAGTVVYLGRHLAPNRRASSINVNDLCVWKFPYQAGNVMPNGQTFANDTYYWKVKAYSPAATSGGAWSDQVTFRLDVNTSVTANGGYGWCNVNVRYPGLAALAGGAPIRVQAFRTRSFNGIADAEKQLSAAGSVTLAGLVPGLYYFRAYVDQNNNRQRDNWESYGYLRDVVNAIEPFRVIGADASTLGMTPTVSITIRDADTDNDLIPDATEYIMWGASGGDWLAKAGPGPIVSSPGGTDYDGDNLNDASELDAGTSIFNSDTDGDGILDRLDRDLLGFDPTAPERLRITGLDLTSGSIGWRWEAAGTGAGIVSLAAPGAEVFSLGQTLNYSVEFTESLVNPDWQPVSTVASGVSGGQITLPQIRSTSGFFRIRMLTE